jgi:hypothetical protein
MTKFLADESVDFRIVTHLREDGYEVDMLPPKIRASGLVGKNRKLATDYETKTQKI